MLENFTTPYCGNSVAFYRIQPNAAVLGGIMEHHHHIWHHVVIAVAVASNRDRLNPGYQTDHETSRFSS